MIQLLFLVLFMEGCVCFFLIVKVGPLREMVMKGLDYLKMGNGHPAMKTVACTMGVIFLSSVYNIFKIQAKSSKLGTMTPMDQVLWRTHLLEASLIGFSLFLGFVVYRLHHYLQKLARVRGTLVEVTNARDTLKKSFEDLESEMKQLKKAEDDGQQKIQKLQKDMGHIEEDMNKLKLECDEKGVLVKIAEARVAMLQNQSSDLLLEYDRLLEDNQVLQSHLSGVKI